jgi:hypothetical protein
LSLEAVAEAVAMQAAVEQADTAPEPPIFFLVLHTL